MQCFDILLGCFLASSLALLLFVTATLFRQVNPNKNSGAECAVGLLGDVISALPSWSHLVCQALNLGSVHEQI